MPGGALTEIPNGARVSSRNLIHRGGGGGGAHGSCGLMATASGGCGMSVH